MSREDVAMEAVDMAIPAMVAYGHVEGIKG
jgi:hypothetical protein